jgi:DNA repair protein RecO (recombination protein O)
LRGQKETSQAFLLRSVDHGESNRIVTLFTLAKGKISGMARSARKSRRRFGGALEPFALIEITIKPGNKNLYHIEKATLLDANLNLATDLSKINAAAFILEIVQAVTPEHEPDPGIFALIKTVMSLLSTSPNSATNSVLTAATLKLLSLAGISATVDRCNGCGRTVPEGRKVQFNPARGGIICTPCGGGPHILSETAAHALRALDNRPLASAVEVPLSEDVAVELQVVFKSHIEYHIERPLRTNGFDTPIIPNHR